VPQSALLACRTLVIQFPNTSSAALKPVGTTPKSLPLIGIGSAQLAEVIPTCVRGASGARASESYIVRRRAGKSSFPRADAADLPIGDEDAGAACSVLAVHRWANPIVGTVVFVGGAGATGSAKSAAGRTNQRQSQHQTRKHSVLNNHSLPLSW
jgi:hypothetical protein